MNNPVSVVSSSGKATNLKISFLATVPENSKIGYEPTNSNPIEFYILPLDEQNSIVDANVEDMKHLIDVVWPVPEESESQYNITRWSTGRFSYQIPTQKWGYFKIRSALFSGASEFEFLKWHSLPKS